MSTPFTPCYHLAPRHLPAHGPGWTATDSATLEPVGQLAAPDAPSSTGCLPR